MTATIEAWHFCGRDEEGALITTRGHLPLRVGGTIRHEGEIEMCHQGLHASRRALDALKYAQGPIACRVELTGDIEHEEDKSVGRERKILWAVDATEILKEFARKCALDVAHLWDAPKVVRQFLETGDESLREAAWEAAWAAWAAARATAGAAWAAARGATWAAWGAAAGEAAGEAAWEAAGAAARATAGATAGEAAGEAAQNEHLEEMLTKATRIHE